MIDPFIEYAPPAPTDPVLSYPPSLPHDVACAMSSEEVELLRIKYEFTPEEFDYILQRGDFKREYSEWTQRLVSEGNSFKLKLRAMSEAFLPQLNELLTSDTTAPSVKVDTFKYITKVAGLEPTKAEVDGESTASGTKIVIQIAGYAATPGANMIDITPRAQVQNG